MSYEDEDSHLWDKKRSEQTPARLAKAANPAYTSIMGVWRQNSERIVSGLSQPAGGTWLQQTVAN